MGQIEADVFSKGKLLDAIVQLSGAQFCSLLCYLKGKCKYACYRYIGSVLKSDKI